MGKEGMDKSLFFLTLSAVCVWLVVDVALGKNYLGHFLSTLFPFMNDSGTVATMTTEEVEKAQETAPDSTAVGSGDYTWGGNRANGNYSTNGQIVGDEYRKN